MNKKTKEKRNGGSSGSEGTDIPCQVVIDTGRILEHAYLMGYSLHRLRRDLRACKDCSFHDDCRALKEFHQVVQIAINEINDEWTIEVEKWR